MKDFMSIETVSFTKDGGLDKTPAHNYTEFRFRTFAPFAFKKFREMFEIGEDDFLSSLCNLASALALYSNFRAMKHNSLIYFPQQGIESFL